MLVAKVVDGCDHFQLLVPTVDAVTAVEAVVPCASPDCRVGCALYHGTDSAAAVVAGDVLQDVIGHVCSVK